MIRLRFAGAAIGLALIPGFLSGQAPPSAREEVVWHWFGACAGRDSMVLEVRLDGKPVYGSTFPMCKQRRSQIKPERQQRLLEFHFVAAPRRFGPHSRAADPAPVNGTIWETGGERNAILLGLSISAEDEVLLNMHYTARMDGESRSERVRGLVITTHPARPSR